MACAVDPIGAVAVRDAGDALVSVFVTFERCDASVVAGIFWIGICRGFASARGGIACLWRDARIVARIDALPRGCITFERRDTSIAARIDRSRALACGVVTN